ncbi:GNAT family N-acetyltransferase [Catellatospora sp. KI3]|uniref:GNAT family N-acetyltransferase n=1 Tax=Catellatospora sp. KI3 TaxID=3041620 RepID=UPI0024825E8D|nr:GNAT family N-acetyltransferase [Catellatospora sp. KI3]MDI1462687.1 GNAT family N-acetyltransferase [Catellatospora sp. KI3]
MDVEYTWRGEFTSDEADRLHAEGFGYDPVGHDWRAQVERHSLGWVCARAGGRLVGFVNVIWDGSAHAFLLDTVAAADLRRQGVGARLVEVAVERSRAAGCEWLHVDFEEHLDGFYFAACGFTPTRAGLIRLA